MNDVGTRVVVDDFLKESRKKSHFVASFLTIAYKFPLYR